MSGEMLSAGAIICFTAGGLLFGEIAYRDGIKEGKVMIQTEAVERGHAEYVVKDGNVVFQWKGEHAGSPKVP